MKEECNYREQAVVNLNSFCNDEKYVEKKTFLLKLARRFNELNIRWCLTCSSTMFFRGITLKFIDILIHWEDISKALAVVKEMHAVDLVKGDQSHFASTLFNKYVLGDVYFDLFAEWRIKDPFHFTYMWTEDYIEAFEIDGVTIYIVAANIQFNLYAAFTPFCQEKRLAQAMMVGEYLQALPEKRPIFNKYVKETKEE